MKSQMSLYYKLIILISIFISFLSCKESESKMNTEKEDIKESQYLEKAKVKLKTIKIDLNEDFFNAKYFCNPQKEIINSKSNLKYKSAVDEL